MTVSREKSIYHLTPAGWTIGDLPPVDHVESWNCCVEDVPRAKRYVEWTRMWTNPEVARPQRDRLRELFWSRASSGTIQPVSRSRQASA